MGTLVCDVEIKLNGTTYEELFKLSELQQLAVILNEKPNHDDLYFKLIDDTVRLTCKFTSVPNVRLLRPALFTPNKTNISINGFILVANYTHMSMHLIKNNFISNKYNEERIYGFLNFNKRLLNKTDTFDTHILIDGCTDNYKRDFIADALENLDFDTHMFYESEFLSQIPFEIDVVKRLDDDEICDLYAGLRKLRFTSGFNDICLHVKSNAGFGIIDVLHEHANITNDLSNLRRNATAGFSEAGGTYEHLLSSPWDTIC
ncbi:hypothetical protein HNP86_001998 [Methanococcus maripaludis]|uniref:Uncharacterized protein n=1 Tax=Methanococcus maripaludis TaxID=39152 RepID=A0A7J9NVY0_METMI|nr:hypothetical protein [Methanococcus maripaludis]MBA2851839.1 hypothetical protein [Methanococcus maripaludis]